MFMNQSTIVIFLHFRSTWSSEPHTCT